MLIFKNKAFHRWAKEEGLDNENLVIAVNEMKNGLYDANLSGSIYKKRVPIGHKGKRGGARTIVAFKVHDKAIFIYGFSKNERANITHKEQEALKALAKIYFGYTENQINQAIKIGELIEMQS